MADDRPLNLMLPGNPRYQPKGLIPYFGYDHLMQGLARVEIATLQTLGELDFIPAHDIALLTPELIDQLLAITTTEVDKVERQITKHDVRAWVRIAQGILPPQLGRWVHVPLTSYDALDSGRILHYVDAYRQVVKPAVAEVIGSFIQLVRTHANTLQIGRTHGQHALPITVGFWLATVLDRVARNAFQLNATARYLVGKISGAVGAYNAQVGLGIARRCLPSEDQLVEAEDVQAGKPMTFEDAVLDKVGLWAAPISTQILPPEPLANFLFACCLLSASLGQFGRDCRHLMRSEIAEVAEAFEAGQVGSSTMAQKRNPIWCENVEGIWLRTKNEFGKVMDTLISEHQRDLVGSCVMRDFPIIVVNLQTQLDVLLRQNDKGVPFLSRLTVNAEACQRNLAQSANVILAEPLYIALLMAGYKGDAHALVNEQLMPRVQRRNRSLIEELGYLAGEILSRGDEDQSIPQALDSIPAEISTLLHRPEEYIGATAAKALEIAEAAEQMLQSDEWMRPYTAKT